MPSTDTIDEELMRFALKHAGDGIVVQDERGLVLWANDAYCQMCGYDLDEIAGRNSLEYCMPADQTPSAEEIANFRYDMDQANDRKLVLHQYQHKNGDLFWIQISESVTPATASRDARMILVCRDVSDEIERNHALEEAQKQLFELSLIHI